MLGVRKFHQEKFKEMHGIFEMLSKGQHPDILFITCIDSRVVPNLLTNSGPGDMLVVRNPGNIIPPETMNTGSSEAATIEFALNSKDFNVQHIIICGHSDCGAMKGLLRQNKKELPKLTSWLQHSSAVLEKLREKEEDIKIEDVIKQNILLQIEHLKTYPLITTKIASKELSIHGWFYKIETGEIFVYQESQQAFIGLEQALSFSVEERRNQIVRQVANEYLAKFTQPKTADEFHATMQLFALLKSDLAAIWDNLKPLVSKELWTDLGGLYSSPSDKEFQDLLDLGVKINLGDLKNFQKKLQSSVGYHQFCSQHTLFAKSSLIPSILDLNLDLNDSKPPSQ